MKIPAHRWSVGKQFQYLANAIKTLTIMCLTFQIDVHGKFAIIQIRSDASV